MPREGEGRDLQGMEHQRLPVNLQKPGEGPGTDPHSQPSEGSNPANTFFFAGEAQLI